MNDSPPSLVRAASVHFDESCSFELPCYYPSISSIKTNLPPIEYLRILVALRHPCFLISAYDIFYADELIQLEMKQLICEALENGTAVLLDSGNYESYWWQDGEWSTDKFMYVLKAVDSVPCFSFDSRQMGDGNDVVGRAIMTRVLLEQSTGHDVIPIIHANGSDIETIALELVKQLCLTMVAIPERTLGDGIIQRAKSVARIRRALNSCGCYVPIHLLGTGNPLSILLYVICGADCFDGLEWCQTAVDHRTGLLYHFHQRELFGNQNEFCEMYTLPYTQATLAHNLLFYRTWVERIRNSMADGTIVELAEQYYPQDVLTVLTGSFAL